MLRDDEPIRPVDMTRTCRDCFRQFVINVSEQKFFRDRELSIPNRCADCRKQRRRADLYKTGHDV